jgi:hypothetical protein
LQVESGGKVVDAGPLRRKHVPLIKINSSVELPNALIG